MFTRSVLYFMSVITTIKYALKYIIILSKTEEMGPSPILTIIHTDH